MSETNDHITGSPTLDSTYLGARSIQPNPSVEAYEADGVRNSCHGVNYQLRLLIFFILRGLENKYSFSISIDTKNAEKFDYVLLRLQNESTGGYLYRLLHPKHRAGNNPGRITTSALLSESTNGDFNLRAYFESYLKLRSRFSSARDETQDIIICTNVGFKNRDRIGGVKLSEAFVLKEKVDEILQIRLLRFKKVFKGRETLKEVLLKPLKGMIHDEVDVEEFLDKLSFAMNQYDNDALGKKNMELLKKQCCVSDIQTVFPLFEKKTREWMMSFKGRYFTALEAQIFMDSLEDKFGGMVFQFQDAVWNFTGRKRELNEIETARENGFKTVVISGLGGLGKSELARMYIKEHLDVFKRIIWMTADNRGMLLNSFHKLAERLGINLKEKQTGTIMDEIYAFFQGSDSVFVLDNAVKFSFETEGSDYVKDFLPSTPNRPFVILTSRSQWDWEDASNLLLNEIEYVDAVEFIRSNLPPEAHSNTESIKRLAASLQNFPLALQQAVAYIKRKYMDSVMFGEKYNIDNYLESFVKEAGEMLNFRILSISQPDYEKTTMSTLTMTLKLIKESTNGDMALKILSLISFFAPDNIDTKNVAVYFGENQHVGVKESLRLLNEFSVIVLHANRIRIHRLVQKVMRLKLKETGEDDKMLKWALRSALEIEVDHKISLWENLEEYDSTRIQYSYLASKIIDSLTDSLRYEHACLFGRKSISVLKKICEPTDANLLNAMDSLASALFLSVNYSEAIKINEAILSAVKDVELRDYCDVQVEYNDQRSSTVHHEGCKQNNRAKNDCRAYMLNSLYKIANCHSNLGNYDKVLENYRKVYSTECQILGEDHPKTLGSQYRIALCLSDMGKYTKALTLYKDVYKTQKKILGDKHPDTLTTKYEIGRCVKELGDYTTALALFEEVYYAEREILGGEHPDTLHTKYSIAQCYSNLGEYAKSLKHFEEVYIKRKKILGDKHPETLCSMYEMGQRYKCMGEYNEALTIFGEICDKQREIIGESPLSTLTSKYSLAQRYFDLEYYAKALILFEEFYHKQTQCQRNDAWFLRYEIAQCYKNLGEYTKALTFFEEINDKLEQEFEEGHFFALTMKYGLAQCCSELGFYWKAQTHCMEAYNKQANILGEENPAALCSKYEMTRCYRILGGWWRDLLEEVYNKQKGILGDRHPHVLNTRHEIGQYHLELGETNEALKLYEEVYKQRKEILGINHPDAMISKYEIATCFSKLGDCAKALIIHEEAYEKLKEILGDNHPKTLRSKYGIAVCHSDLGNDAKASVMFEEVYVEQKKILGDTHPETLNSRIGIADSYSKSGDYREALLIYEEVIEHLKEIFGEHHNRTMAVKFEINVIKDFKLSYKGRISRAISRLAEILEIFFKVMTAILLIRLFIHSLDYEDDF